MGYWRAKKELEFILQYRETVVQFWIKEQEIDDIINQSNYPRHYMPPHEGHRINELTEAPRRARDSIRERIAKDTPHALRIAGKHRIPIVVTSSPAPAVGGMIINFYLFDAILRDPSHGKMIGQGVEKQTILDGINAAIGMCEEEVKTQWNHLRNPLYWIKAAFIFVLRIPASLIALAGFNIEKFEEHFWGKFIQLVWILLVLGILLALGVTRGQVVEVVRKLIMKE